MSESLQVPTPQISVGAITQDDLREAMNPGAPSYEDQFGMSSANLGQPSGVPQTLAQLELEAAQKMAQATNPLAGMTFADPNAALLQAQLEEFKKKYGDGENEKGQLRRERDELMEAFNGLSAQFEAMRAAGPVGPQSYAQPQFQPPIYGGDPFADIADDDVLQGKQFKRFIEERLAPAYGQMQSQVQQSFQRQQALEAQLLAQTKAGAGINRLTEFRLMGRNPWLNGLPEPNKIAAMQSLLAAEKAQQPQASANGVPAQTAAQVQDRILSRTTYIEGSNPQVQDASQAALEAAGQRDFAKAMTLPEEDGSRARALRALSHKNGWGWGQPSDLAR